MPVTSESPRTDPTPPDDLTCCQAHRIRQSISLVVGERLCQPGEHSQPGGLGVEAVDDPLPQLWVGAACYFVEPCAPIREIGCRKTGEERESAGPETDTHGVPACYEAAIHIDGARPDQSQPGSSCRSFRRRPEDVEQQMGAGVRNDAQGSGGGAGITRVLLNPRVLDEALERG